MWWVCGRFLWLQVLCTVCISCTVSCVSQYQIGISGVGWTIGVHATSNMGRCRKGRCIPQKAHNGLPQTIMHPHVYHNAAIFDLPSFIPHYCYRSFSYLSSSIYNIAYSNVFKTLINPFHFLIWRKAKWCAISVLLLGMYTTDLWYQIERPV